MSDSAGRVSSPDRCALGHEDCGWTVLHNAMVEDAESAGRVRSAQQIIEDWLNDLPDARERAERIVAKLAEAGYTLPKGDAHHEGVWGLVEGSCECECPKCFREREFCLCPDCTDEAHDHRHRRVSAPARTPSPEGDQ